VLQTLALLQTVRRDHSFWFVLLSDVPSYVSASLWDDTNAPASIPPAVPATFPFPKGFLAEVSVPERGDAMRRTLTQLVTDLRDSGIFSNVDLLPADRRRAVVDPTLVLPEQHFTLALELPSDRFPNLAPVPNRQASTNAPGTQRRPATTEVRSADKQGVTGPVREP
jgi:hypothetical protein